ncbi:MAG: N-acetylmuramoyl-L-alanine amidase [Endomicrobium sp.]|jgi:N-acetylmuramoyl-L-alanine amidase|nr:N-acetylmuramoyl-L-alanine amidase [Endomicrobium sp.]
MKKLINLFMAFLMFLCGLPAYAAEKNGVPESQPVFVIIDGNAFSGVSAYTITEKTKFFSVKELAEIYNAALEWKPVSSAVTMHLNGKKIDIKANSREVTFGKKVKKTEMPSRLIKNDLYVSPEFLTLKEFSEAALSETTWNDKTDILTITSYSNINSVRYFTRPEETQVVVELSENLPYTISKASGSIILNIHRGQVQRDFVYANNGAVTDILYNTEGRDAVVKINLQQTPKIVKSAKLKNPYRITVDIEHSQPVDLTSLPDSSIPDSEEYNTLPDYLKDNEKLLPGDYGEAEITEVAAAAAPIEAGKDNSDLAKIPVVKFEEKAIIDDSYSIVDDTASAEGLIPKKTAKRLLKKKRIIVIDAGHGGEDPGAIGPNGTKETDINLSIAHELDKIFRSDDDYEVILTRKDDTFIPLVDRTNIANEYNADLFVSVHCNSNLGRNVNGFEIYFLSEKATDAQSAATATLENSVVELEGKPTKKRALLQEMLWSMMINEYINESSELCSFISGETPGRLKIPNRGVKQANFYVLRGAQMPSVLVESAFISNYSEESRLNSKKFQAAVADSIYEGIKKYYARKDKLNGKK